MWSRSLNKSHYWVFQHLNDPENVQNQIKNALLCTKSTFWPLRPLTTRPQGPLSCFKRFPSTTNPTYINE